MKNKEWEADNNSKRNTEYLGRQNQKWRKCKQIEKLTSFKSL